MDRHRPSGMAAGGRSLAAALAVVTTLLLPAASAGQLLRVYYPDIEQGSSTLVVSPTGHALLVDAGSGINPTDEDIVGFLEGLVEAGIVASLDYVVASHYDEDHIGRLDDVLNFGPVAPGVVAYDRGEFFDTPGTFAFFDYRDAAEAKNRLTITPFTDIDLGGGVTVECLTVNGELRDGSMIDITGSGSFENSASIGLVVRYGDFDLWIGGDLTGNPEFGNNTDVEGPVAPLAGDLDVYTVNHHGSRSSSSQLFLDTLRAEVVINQNSVSNTFGHPNAEVVARIVTTPDSFGALPPFYQLNPGDPSDDRSDDTLASGIADPDDVDEVLGLPGTVTLVSDGTSYQIFGGNLGPVVRPADSGPGAIGDFPPAILTVSRAPLVPLATEAVAFDSRVTDESLVSVEVAWSAGGVAQAPVAMTPAGGDLWQATLPAQPDGTLVRAWVEAADSLGQVARSTPAAWYSGITPIGALKTVDADGVLEQTGTAVRVEGNLTVEPGVFNEFVSQLYVQDATGGLFVFDRVAQPLERGDRVQFVGEIEQGAGLTEVNIAEAYGNFGYTLIGPGVPPEPTVVTAAQVGEAVEGSLVRIDGLTVVEGSIPPIGNGTLLVTDDGGATLLTLFIDGETDLPGSPTPTQTFDLIAVAAQFDTSFPLTGGYEIIPRSRTDFLTDEVNLPPMLIHEIFADPHPTYGDANGDGVADAADDQFVELVNTGFDSLDISGWALDTGGIERHLFPSGTVVPALEAVVVFGGGTPIGPFGNAQVFTASSGTLGLAPGGGTVALRDASGALVQTEAFAGRRYVSVTRSPDGTNTPFVDHRVAAGGSTVTRLFSPGTRADGQAFTIAPGTILLAEVMYDPTGSDDGLEWIELANATQTALDLSSLTLGAGGGDYTNTLVQLTGVIPAGGTFVIGGPDSTPDNGTPIFDLVVDFSPDLQNSGTTADGVALFNLPISRITETSVPIDAVVYGETNLDGLIDETGMANPPEVGDAPSGASIERLDLAGEWIIQTTPTPNSWPPPPPPPPVLGVLITEVLYDPSGSDDLLEWVEIVNTNDFDVDLSAFSLGNGGSDYTASLVQLSGTIPAGAVWVVGGPLSTPDNGLPQLDLAIDFSPDFQNSGTTADGVALFNVPAAQVTAVTVPIDAVVYGGSNDNGLIDETGLPSPPEVGDAPAGSSIERVDAAGAWQIQGVPTPNAIPF